MTEPEAAEQMWRIALWYARWPSRDVQGHRRNSQVTLNTDGRLGGKRQAATAATLRKG
jgi:hypothetical protein